MPKDFDDKVLIVTGSSTGLGAAIAIGAAQRGAKAVIVNYARSANEAEETADRVRTAGAEVVVVQGNVGEDSDCRRIAEAASRYRRIDALANNAGATKTARNHSDLATLSKQDFLDVFAVNAVGPFMMIRACRSLLDASDRASVLMTSSIAAVIGTGSSVAYAASKGALNTMTLSLARALAPKIRVNAICPGFIDTGWFARDGDEKAAAAIRENVQKNSPLKIVAKAEDVAESALFLLSGASRHITGETLMIDSGMHLGFSPAVAR